MLTATKNTRRILIKELAYRQGRGGMSRQTSTCLVRLAWTYRAERTGKDQTKLSRYHWRAFQRAIGNAFCA